MKINLNEIDAEQFMIHPHVVDGQTLFLVQPQHIGAKFTQANKHFRSSVWDADGNLVSAGFPKFTNWGENPEHFPVPESLKDTQVVEKIDGSLLIVSMWNGKLMLRTRGTVDATKLDNGHELALFLQKHGKEVEYLLTGYPSGPSYSLLFEWVSPNQRIILNYGDEPDWFLVGCVNHDNYLLTRQADLDYMANEYGFKRPPSYTFPDITALLAHVEKWKGKEGVVIYSNDGQSQHKAKGLWYLALHRMKEALASFDKVVDVWYEQGEPSYAEFEDSITMQFDYELWSQIRGEASRICDASKDVHRIIDGMQKFVNDTILPMGDPKDKKARGAMARLVTSSYGITNRANFVFKLMDGKGLDSEDRKKLLYQVLKK
jgi:hypothetical protein